MRPVAFLMFATCAAGPRPPAPNPGSDDDPWKKRLDEAVAREERRRVMVDTLADPRPVRSWTEEGLALEAEPVVKLPGLTKLPRVSDALNEAIPKGVEITPEGRVFALVRIRHQESKQHLARVDLALLLMFLGEGEAARKPPRGCSVRGGTFSNSGWWDEEFNQFQEWCRTYFR